MKKSFIKLLILSVFVSNLNVNSIKSVTDETKLGLEVGIPVGITIIVAVAMYIKMFSANRHQARPYTQSESRAIETAIGRTVPPKEQPILRKTLAEARDNFQMGKKPEEVTAEAANTLTSSGMPITKDQLATAVELVPVIGLGTSSKTLDTIVRNSIPKVETLLAKQSTSSSIIEKPSTATGAEGGEIGSGTIGKIKPNRPRDKNLQLSDISKISQKISKNEPLLKEDIDGYIKYLKDSYESSFATKGGLRFEEYVNNSLASLFPKYKPQYAKVVDQVRTDLGIPAPKPSPEVIENIPQEIEQPKIQPKPLVKYEPVPTQDLHSSIAKQLGKSPEELTILLKSKPIAALKHGDKYYQIDEGRLIYAVDKDFFETMSMLKKPSGIGVYQSGTIKVIPYEEMSFKPATIVN